MFDNKTSRILIKKRFKSLFSNDIVTKWKFQFV